jgi:hypothetical protein
MKKPSARILLKVLLLAIWIPQALFAQTTTQDFQNQVNSNFSQLRDIVNQTSFRNCHIESSLDDNNIFQIKVIQNDIETSYSMDITETYSSVNNVNFGTTDDSPRFNILSELGSTLIRINNQLIQPARENRPDEFPATLSAIISVTTGYATDFTFKVIDKSNSYDRRGEHGEIILGEREKTLVDIRCR